jgi:4-hydroxymandelate oxidase
LQYYATQAQQRLEPAIWNYLNESGILTQSANRHALDHQQLMPRILSNVRGGHTRITLFSQTLDHPILLAPMAYQRLFHPQGEIASAMAASAQGGLMIISSLASQPLEAIVAAHLDSGYAPWFQLYWQGDIDKTEGMTARKATLQLVQRALTAGCTAIVLTVDAPVKPASFQLPAGVRAVNLPHQSTDSNPAQRPRQIFDDWMQQAPTWDDLIWLRDQIQYPLLIKGVLHPHDAQRIIEIGCDGIVISNHGGRVLDSMPASLTALSVIHAETNGKIPLLFDSGIRSGLDVFKALELGASAVLLGRPALWGLAANGAMGVAQVIRIIRDELECTMALCGKDQIKHNMTV